MKNTKDDLTHVPSSFGRRSFLFATAGGGVAGAAAVAQATGLQAPAAPTPEALAEPEGEGQGYRVTRHVERYYRSTRL